MVANVRHPVTVFLACAVTLILFTLMQHLIGSAEPAIDENYRRVDIDFAPQKQESQAKLRERILPKRIQPKVEPDVPQTPRNDMDDPNATSVAVAAPTFDQSADIGRPSMPTAGWGSDADATPIVRVEPIYPRRAAEQMIEGYVVLRFDVTPTGATANVRVVDSEPGTIFDRAAVQAVSKWKYRAKVADGKSYSTRGLKVKLTFKLN